MTIFFEETSIPSDMPETNRASGIYAPPPSPLAFPVAPSPLAFPVEYFSNAYGGSTVEEDGPGIGGAAWESWKKLVGGGNDDVMAGIVAAMEGAGEATVRKQEDTTARARVRGGGESSRKHIVKKRNSRKPKREAKAGSVAKIPLKDRVFRNCRACGTRNHNRRLFCTGCYGGKHEMGYVEDTEGL